VCSVNHCRVRYATNSFFRHYRSLPQTLQTSLPCAWMMLCCTAPLQDCLEPSLDHTKSTHMMSMNVHNVWMRFVLLICCLLCWVASSLLLRNLLSLNVLYIYFFTFLYLPFCTAQALYVCLHDSLWCLPSCWRASWRYSLACGTDYCDTMQYSIIMRFQCVKQCKTYISMYFLDLLLIYVDICWYYWCCFLLLCW